MIINLEVSQNALESVASLLETVIENINSGVNETVEIMTNEGAMKAESAYGGMATVSTSRPNETTGVIEASGDAAIIAEFGAGEMTIEENPFEYPPSVPVYRWSYSELVGTQEGYATGKWHFGGKEYRYVKPRRGLYKAKQHIIGKMVEVAQGAIHYD